MILQATFNNWVKMKEREVGHLPSHRLLLFTAQWLAPLHFRSSAIYSLTATFKFIHNSRRMQYQINLPKCKNYPGFRWLSLGMQKEVNATAILM